jgi:uncharacterized protein (TIGR01777 family)
MFADEKIQLVRWDSRNLNDWVEHLDGADAVVNLAGESISGENFLPDRWNSEKKKRIRDSRVSVGKILVEAIEQVENKPGVLVQASAVGYYGSTGDALITEASPPGNDFLASVTKDWEASTEPVEAMGVRRVVTRIGIVLSTESGALPRLLLPSRLLAGGWFGSGDQWWSWVHIADVVEALRFVIENEAANGPVNLTAPEPVTNKEFSKALGRAMSRPSLVPVPAFALRMALGEVAVTVLEGQRVIPERLLDLGYTFHFTDIDAALDNLINEKNSSGAVRDLMLA